MSLAAPGLESDVSKIRFEPSFKSSETEIRASKTSRNRKKKAELRAQHSVHDRLQLESNFTFDLRPREGEEQRDFKVDFYLFLPSAMGVESSTFTSKNFFRHLTNHFRVRAPQYHQLKSLEPSELRFESAEKYFVEHLSSYERAKLSPKLVQDVKLFGNFLHTELKKLRSAMASKRKLSKPKSKSELASILLHRVELLWSFRKRYVSVVRAERFLQDEEVVRAFTLTDEYLSYRLELVLLRARDSLGVKCHEIDDLLSKEVEYREENNLLVLGGGEQDSVVFEGYTYRLGLLKKYLSESLFVELVSNKKDNLYKNYAAAIGAGLAATVAGLAEHQRVQYLTGDDSGFRLAFLIGVAVLAYIFKDRVKDLSKEYFNSRLKEKLPDQSFALSHKSYTSKGSEKIRDLGTASDFFRFMKDVPSDVAYLRTLGQTKASDPERHENIVHIGRRFSFGLRSKKHRKLFPLLKNVYRIDISPFLSKLDNPMMPINYLGQNGDAKTVLAPKVYHVNFVLRSEVRFGTEEDKRFVDYERFRLIVNKNGIVRLEKILEPGTMAYEEILK